jgi:hypothetical protein
MTEPPVTEPPVTLPPVVAPVLAAAVDALPNRLRRKLDDAVAAAASWTVTVRSGHWTVAVDAQTTVTVTAEGTVTDAAQVTCTCLLSPNCLHRAAVLATAPAADAAPPPDAPATEGTAEAEQAELTGEQRAAAAHLWQAGAAVVGAGVAGSGVVLRTALLRATHEARVHGLHRAASAGRAVAAHLRAASESLPQYRLGDLTDQLRELLTVTWRLRDGSVPADPTLVVSWHLGQISKAALVGTARRRYDVRGSLRLYGLCTVPVVAETGYAGVVTYLVDRDARLWAVTDLMPGGPERVPASANGPVALGEAALSHRELGRAGLVVSGATGSDTGTLGAGAAVRAVRAAGAGWSEEPLDALWAEPLTTQVPRAFRALALPPTDRPAGADLLFLAGALRGTTLATADGTVVTLGVPSDHPGLPYRENLAVLAARPATEVRLVARPDPGRPLHVHPLALSSAALTADLGLDRLRRKEEVPEAEPAAVPPPAAPPAADLPLHLVRRGAERVVAGGRAVQALAAGDRDERRVHAARLETGAALLRALTVAAGHRPRDAYGQPVDDAATFARTWLSVAVYEQAASWAFAEASWLPSSAE